MALTVVRPSQVSPPVVQIERHPSDGRPKIYQWCSECDGTGRVPSEKTGKPVKCKPCKGEGKRGSWYSRTTTFIDALTDKSSIAKWQQRMLATGIAQNPEFLDEIRAIRDPFGDGAEALNVLCERIRDAAGASHKAEQGTALHELTEEIDQGRVPSFIPPEYEPSILAYREVTRDMEMVAVEEFAVHDDLRVAGTLDRGVIVKGELAGLIGVPEGTAMVGDLKTGNIHYDFAKIAMQVAFYARMSRYNPITLERGQLTLRGEPISTTHGLLIHMPSDGTHAAVYPLDLDRGWAAVQVVCSVREERRYWSRVGSRPPAVRHADGLRLCANGASVV